MPKLVIQKKGTEEKWVHELAEAETDIGRQDGSAVLLRSHGVSRSHARIIAAGGNFFVVDLKSGNGTYLNGAKLLPNEKNLLRAGDTIMIDAFDISFQTSEDSLQKIHEEEVTESDILEVKLLKKVLSALDKDMVPSLEILNGALAGKKVFLTDETGELVIGRDPECAFPINEHVISRSHAKVIKRWGGIAIRDMESKNGTFLNNRRVVEEYLHDGDRIALGTIVLLFRNPQEINMAGLAGVRPKNAPQKIMPSEIPGLAGKEAEGHKEPPAERFSEEMPEEAGEGTPAEGPPALDDWEELDRQAPPQTEYPKPQAKTEKFLRLTPIEIGMIGLGVLVIIFAMVTIVNLMAS